MSLVSQKDCHANGSLFSNSLFYCWYYGRQRGAILYFALIFELLSIEAVIVSSLAQELGVRTHFRDAAFFNDNNPVRSADGRQAVSNDK